jgi:ferredoxin
MEVVMKMKVRIDQDVCIECGLCASTCPDVFVLNAGEKASIVECYQNGGSDIGEVGESLRTCAEDAAGSCPVEAISTE